MNRTNGRHFFTSSATERDNLMRNDYKYEGIAFFEPQTGTAVYRLFRGFEHFYTSNVQEARSLLQSGASLDGVDWHTSNGGQPVYRLVNKTTSEHLWTISKTEADTITSSGQWSTEGIAFNAYSSIIDDPSYTYKLTNSASHQIQLTTSTKVVKDTVDAKNGWTYTGIAWKNDQNGTIKISELQLGNEKFYTANETEKNSLVANGATLTADSKFMVTGTGGEVLRLLNTKYKTHEFTANKEYANSLVATGEWKLEGVAWKSDAIMPAQDIYRLVSTSGHFWTSSVSELETMQIRGWNYEGVSWKAPSTGTPVTRLSSSNGHFWSENQAEVAHLAKHGYTTEGTAFNSGGNTEIYRLLNPHSGEHFFTANPAEKNNLLLSGWNYEGVGMHGV
ncbi:MAG: hypothetical protein LBI63_00395 [Candidatus Ancillula sp.]|nr:hypothetical protein [Candidatus Ancillula sp.]